MRRVVIFLLAALLLLTAALPAWASDVVDTAGDLVQTPLEKDGDQPAEDDLEADEKGEEPDDADAASQDWGAKSDGWDAEPTSEPTPPPEVIHPEINIEVQLGYGGVTPYLSWIPISVAIENTGADVSGAVCVDISVGNNEYVRYECPVTLAGDSRKKLTIPVRLTTRQSVYTIEFCVDGETIASVNAKPSRALAQGVYIGVLAQDTTSLAYVNASQLVVSETSLEQWFSLPLDAENFPDTPDMMSTFSILIVDSFDMRTLSTAQQQAFRNWLHEGGIVIVGGGAQAAQTYPFFEEWTGVKAGSLTDATNFLVPLANFVGWIAEEPENPTMVANAAADPAKAETLVKGDVPLIYRSGTDGGLIYTASFALSAKGFSQWTEAKNYFKTLLNKANAAAYAARTVTDPYRDVDHETYQMRERVMDVPVSNSFRVAPFLVVLIAVLLLMGLGGYFVLKRMDKRSLLWITIPTIAVAGALIIGYMSSSSAVDQSMMASVALISVDEDGKSKSDTYVGVTTSQTGEVTVSTVGASLFPLFDPYGNYYYYDYSIVVPPKMAYRKTVGEADAIGMPQSHAWDSHIFSYRAPSEPFRISGRATMDKNELSFEITNDSDVTIYGGLFICPMGYANVPDLLPGDTSKLRLRQALSEDEKKAAKNMRYTDGVFTPIGMTGNANFYQMVQDAMYPQLVNATAEEEEAFWRNYDRNKEDGFRLDMLQSFGSEGFMYGKNLFMFIGFTDDMQPPEILLNGERIQRSGHRAVVQVKLGYDPKGPDGSAFYPARMIVPERIVHNADGSIGSLGFVSYKNDYTVISENPTYRFSMPEVGTLEIEKITLIAHFYTPMMPQLSIYNPTTGEWEEQKNANMNLTGEEARKYTVNGEFVIKYEPVETMDRYADMESPYIEIAGKVK